MKFDEASDAHNYTRWIIIGLILLVAGLSFVYANFRTSSGSFLSGDENCSEIEFSQSGELVMNKTSGNIYASSGEYQAITKVPLNNGEMIASASNRLIVTTTGRIFEYADSKNTGDPRLVGRIPTKDIVAVTQRTMGGMCLDSLSGGCTRNYKFSVLSEDGSFDNYRINTDRFDESLSDLKTTKQFKPSHTIEPQFDLKNNEEFRWISGRLSRLFVATTHGIYEVSKGVFDDDVKTTATTTLEFGTPINLLDVVENIEGGKEEKFYSKAGKIYQASSDTLKQTGTLPEAICQLGQMSN